MEGGRLLRRSGPKAEMLTEFAKSAAKTAFSGGIRTRPRAQDGVRFGTDMSPQERITDLCQRYGVSASFGQRMLPLALRAEEVRPELRRRMHAFLERSFLAQAEIETAEAAAKADAATVAPGDLRALQTVAGVLHRWDPPKWLDRWVEKVQRSE